MIDLHGHLCFDVDDGPTTATESLALARALETAGVTDFACTSHFRPDKGWRNDRDKAAHNMAILEDTLGNIGPRRVAAAEHYVHDETFAPGFEDRVVPYGSSHWLLVETPYAGAPVKLRALLARIRRAGFRVLLAHIERFSYLHHDKRLLDELQEDGIIFQVNLGSLVGAYGGEHKRVAARLLKDGVVGILAGDCHRAEDVELNITQGLAAATALVGEQVVQRLTVDAPRAILDDAPAHRVWP
jgi:protein-tyrosine phosphatase